LRLIDFTFNNNRYQICTTQTINTLHKGIPLEFASADNLRILRIVLTSGKSSALFASWLAPVLKDIDVPRGYAFRGSQSVHHGAPIVLGDLDIVVRHVQLAQVVLRVAVHLARVALRVQPDLYGVWQRSEEIISIQINLNCIDLITDYCFSGRPVKLIIDPVISRKYKNTPSEAGIQTSRWFEL
jgi:hypothetical protein